MEYSRLSLRAVAQRPLEFFLSNRHWLDDHLANHGDKKVFGTTVGDDPEPFVPGQYRELCSLAKHDSDPDSKRGMGRIFWLVVAAAFNIRRLQLSGYFGDASRRKAMKTKVHSKQSLTEEEKVVARFLVNILQGLVFNTHAVLQQVR